MLTLNLAFSIPKADRWAAALPRAKPAGAEPVRFQYPQSGSMGCSGGGPPPPAGPAPVLSVSPKRIDGLQRPLAQIPRERVLAFQYPQSGSMGCSPRRPREGGRGYAGFQYPQSGSMGCSIARAMDADLVELQAFQYPQSGSMGCSGAPQVGEAVPRPRPFSIPKADRWAAAGVTLARSCCR